MKKKHFNDIKNIAVNATTISGISIDRLLKSQSRLGYTFTNWDDAIINGVYSVSDSTWPKENGPTGCYKYGIVLCFKSSDNVSIQIYFPHNATSTDVGHFEPQYRVVYDNRWSPWRRIKFQ